MIYQVVVDISNSNVDKIFDYSYDEIVPIGSRVKVPFGRLTVEGFVIGVTEHAQVEIDKLKPLSCVLDNFVVLNDQMLQLCKWMASKYHLRLIDALRLAVPSQMRNNKAKPLVKKLAKLNNQIEYSDIIKRIKPNATAQLAIIELLHAEGEGFAEEINSSFGNSALKSLIKNNFVIIEEVTLRRIPYNSLDENKLSKPILTEEQSKVVNTILTNEPTQYLLHGVTGSGKTEVYMTLIESVMSKGQSVIMLVPEISLTPSVLKQFRSRFGSKVALLHSGLSIGERYDEWLRLNQGQATIVIGARSAVFAPLDNIGIIIIDEEHDGSYISDSNPRYDTIEVAKQRANLNKCTLLLGSATPSIETYFEATSNRIKLLRLPNRINNRPLPAVQVVDMAMEVRAGNKGMFSQALIDELTKVIESGNQAMLFLNRRGYSSFVMCNKCGYVAKCTDCDVSLSYHSIDNQLKCHYCGKKFHMIDNCPNCKSPYIRQGKIGTQQVVQLLSKLFPAVKVLRMDMDTTRNRDELVNILASFSAREAQILVGTQMIAKGHDFPNVTLVGILDGDISLFQTDYRSSERTFQLLTQVAGRSGRQDLTGKVILQTHSPTHYVLQLAAKQDYISFFNREINIREATKFPPFATLLRILYSGEDSEKCVAQLNSHYEQLVLIMQQYPDNFIFMNKMKSPINRIERKFRYQTLIRLNNDEFTQDIITKIYNICDLRINKETIVFAELSPQNLN